VVSDLHGHVLDIPFVLLTIAFLFSLFISDKITKASVLSISFLLAIMFMTNAWDGLIYLGLTILIFLYVTIHTSLSRKNNTSVSIYIFKTQFYFQLKDFLVYTGILVLTYAILVQPFSRFFDTGAIVHGIGVVCAPEFLTNIGKIGPFLFEANHCQKSPL